MTHDPLLNWQKLQLTAEPELQQLTQITRQLELTLVALLAIIEITLEELQAIATQGNLTLKDRLEPDGKMETVLTVDEARSLALLICHVANQRQPQIRQAVTLLEQHTQQGNDLSQSALLQNYLVRFQQSWKHQSPLSSIDLLEPLALKLLIDLLFCSSLESPPWFWSALVERQLQA
ncbi:MAG: DUF3038 domain-containing protein [Microcoleaceae cyanobacterium]